MSPPSAGNFSVHVLSLFLCYQDLLVRQRPRPTGHGAGRLQEKVVEPFGEDRRGEQLDPPAARGDGDDALGGIHHGDGEEPQLRVEVEPGRQDQAAEVRQRGDDAERRDQLQAPALERVPGQPEAQQVLERAPLPPQPLPGQGAPGQHGLGGHRGVLRADETQPEMLERQRHPVVLGEGGVAVDEAAAGVRQAPGRDRRGHRPQRADPEQCPHAGDAQHPALLAGVVPGVPRVLVPLERAAQAAALAGAEVPADGGVALIELGRGHGDEIRVEEGVGVLDQNGVVVGSGPAAPAGARSSAPRPSCACCRWWPIRSRPCSRAISAVASVQLSQITMTMSGTASGPGGHTGSWRCSPPRCARATARRS